jgi:hypothetical protein
MIYDNYIIAKDDIDDLLLDHQIVYIVSYIYNIRETRLLYV